MEKYYRISGFIQPYAWGGHAGIARLLGQTVPSEKPQAELWMGAHPKGPATIHLSDRQPMPLNEWLRGPGKAALGGRVEREFEGTLPYLFKILDVKDMLSIQSHPNKKQAQIGFAAEEQKGVPITAFNRVYRDDNHKPELMLAVTPFYLLHGFKPLAAIRETLKKLDAWKPLLHLTQSGLPDLYQHIMRCSQEEINGYLEPLRAQLMEKSPDYFPKTTPDHWARKAFQTFARPNGDLDRGILSIYLMNILRLEPGEAIFQDAGILHAYLEGINVEIMANSDNVFRGGLTVKHIAVDELLTHVIMEDRPPFLVKPIRLGPGENIYPTPAPDFELSELRLDESIKTYENRFDFPSIWLIMEGEIDMEDGEAFKKGDQFFLPSGQDIRIFRANQSTAHVVFAGLPRKK